MTDPINPDFSQLMDITLPAVRSIYQAALDRLEGEQIYAVVLTTYSANEGFGLHINTEQNLLKILEAADVPAVTPEDLSSPDYNYYRWYWGEWGELEYIGDQTPLDSTYQWLVKTGDGAPDFEAFTSQVHKAMIEILRKLDEEGLFGTGAERDKILIYAGIYDDEPDIIYASAKAANSPENWAHKEPSLRNSFG